MGGGLSARRRRRRRETDGARLRGRIGGAAIEGPTGSIGGGFTPGAMTQRCRGGRMEQWCTGMGIVESIWRSWWGEGGLLCEGLKGGGLVAQGRTLHELVDAVAELLRQGRNVLHHKTREVGRCSKPRRSQSITSA